MKFGSFKKMGWGLCLLPLILFLVFLFFNLLFPLRNLPSYSPVITDKDGNMMRAFLSTDDKWRMKTGVEEINPLLEKTILYKEDKYFYYHPGVNPVAVGRAFVNNIIQGKKTSGASTITMQVARLLYPAKRNYVNKFTEIIRAFQLEYKFSKSEILQLYINLVPYGGNIEGVKSASWFYFGISPGHVNLSQSVILSIIPNRPGTLNPKKGTAIITRERDKWLKRMEHDQIISWEELLEALGEPVEMDRRPIPGGIPHLAARLHHDDKNEIIKTSIDKTIQEKLEAIAYNHSKRFSLKNIHNMAVLVVENKTRKVRGYLGSPDFRDVEHAGQVDGCNAVRSPGSTLKPMVYGMAIDKGLITPASMLNDVPVNFSGYAPENFNGRCNGLSTSSKALAYSLNIPAVTLLNEIGLREFTERLRKCGFQALHSDAEMGLSIILGGCGTKATELAGMYSALANGGEYVPIKLYEDDTISHPTSLMSESAAFMVTEMLTGLVRPDLPNNFQSSLRIPKIAWKTGTSYGRRDAWSVGYNRKYTIVVWVGNFNGEGVPELTGADMATPVLFELFNAIDYSSENNWYVPPKSTDIRLVCSKSGLPPDESTCTDLITDYFIPSVSSNKKCTHSREVLTTPDESITYCMHCVPDAGYKKIWIDYLPPAVVSFYASNNIEFNKPPPHNPVCTQMFADQPPVITTPVNNKEYLLEKNAQQPLQLSCNAGADIASIFWYLNDVFYTKSKPSETVFFTPQEGDYKISCSDDKGRNQDIRIQVKFY